MATVSVVIPFHNDVATIGSTLASVAQQAHAPLEIIVVDDASTGAAATALDELSRAWPARDIPLHVIHLPENVGPAGARNAGWARAAGDWIALCDADDLWHPQRLEVQLAVAEGASLLSCWRADTPAKMLAPTSGQVPDVRRVTPAAMLALNPIITSGVLIRRNITPRFPQGRRYSEDYELWLRIVLSGDTVLVVRHPLVAPQIPDSQATGLTTHRWEMTRGERETYRRIHRDGLTSAGTHLLTLAGSAVRAARRHTLVVLTRLPRRR